MFIGLKYGPKSIEEFCDDNIRSIVEEKIVNTDNKPRFILIYGEPGTGKTALAYIIARYYADEKNITFLSGADFVLDAFSYSKELWEKGKDTDEKSVVIIDELGFINTPSSRKLSAILKVINKNISVIFTSSKEHIPDDIKDIFDYKSTSYNNDSLKISTHRLDAESNFKMIKNVLYRYSGKQDNSDLLTDTEIYDIINSNDYEQRQYLLEVEKTVVEKLKAKE